jgi:hypothetical protein
VPSAGPPLEGHNPCTIVTLRFVVENGQKTIWGSCENVIFIRNASRNPRVMAVGSKVNVNQKNLIMSLADSCFEFLRDLEKENDPDLVRRRAAEFTEDVGHYSRLIELT